MGGVLWTAAPSAFRGIPLMNMTLSSLHTPKGSARLYSCCMDSDLPSQNFWDDLTLAHKIPPTPPPDDQDMRPAPGFLRPTLAPHIP